MDKNEILDIIRNYELSVEEYKEMFKIICDVVRINDFSFRRVGEIHLCENVLWIDSDTSIDVEDIESFLILNRMKLIHNRKLEIIEK